MSRTEKKFELIVLIFLVILTGVLLFTASTADSVATDGLSSMEFPKYIFMIVIALCLIIMIPNIKTLCKKENNSESKEIFIDKRVGISLAFICSYAILWNVIGFFLSSFLYFSAQAKVLDKEKSNLQIILIGFCVALFIYGVFGFAFKVSFPEPLMEMLLD